jgi:hypothetical protein
MTVMTVMMITNDLKTGSVLDKVTNRLVRPTPHMVINARGWGREGSIGETLL